MKKITSIIALITCAFILAGTVCAAANTIAPSVEAREAPEVEKIVVSDKNGNETEFSTSYIIVTPYSAVKAEREVSEDIKQQLKQAYKEVTETDDLGKIVEELGKEVGKINKAYTSKMFVVTDLFDVSVSENIKEILNGGGKIYVTFKTNYSEKPVIIHRTSEKWEVIDSAKVSIKDGNVTAEFTSLSPIGFLSLSSDNVPSKSESASYVIVIVVIICVFLAIAAAIIIFLKVREQKGDGKKEHEEPKNKSQNDGL